MNNTIIKNATIISMDKKIGDLIKGDILIQDEKIKKIGKSLKSINAVTINAQGIVSLTGVASEGNVSRLPVWGLVDDSQTINYQEVSKTQTSSWGNVSDSQNPNWSDVA